MSNELTEDYLKRGNQWDEDLIYGFKRQRNILAIILIISLLITFASVISVTYLTPLKTIVPLVIEVEKSTGRAVVQTVYDGDVKKLSKNEIIAKYFINKYLIARETFSPNLDLEENYTLVQEFSEGRAWDNYSGRFDSTGPENVFKRYGDNTVKIEINSISFIRHDTASIRYSLIEQMGQGRNIKTRYIEFLNYRFVNSPSDEQSRLKNPLGFKVSEYRVDKEIIK